MRQAAIPRNSTAGGLLRPCRLERQESRPRALAAGASVWFRLMSLLDNHACFCFGVPVPREVTRWPLCAAGARTS
eukprot:4065314-Pyramimonas_sp.AAC.1